MLKFHTVNTFTILIVLFSLAVAGCGGAKPPTASLTQVVPPATATANQEPVSPTQTPVPVFTNAPGETVEQPGSTPTPGEVDQPTVEAAPTDTLEPATESGTSTPQPEGMGRSNPYPPATVVNAPNWDFQVTAFQRGNEAWNSLQTADPTNPPPPDGKEYVLVSIKAKSTYADQEKHPISVSDFKVTGDQLVAYETSDMLVPPSPTLDANLASGEEAEGWIAYVVKKDEGNLMLFLDEMANNDDDRFRFIALEDGASVSIPSDLASIQPTDLGKNPDDPAPRTATVTTQDWQVAVKEVVRGDQAWKMIQQADEATEPPPDGMEYTAVKVHVRYIGLPDQPMRIDNFYFTSTDSSGQLYDFTTVTLPPPGLEVLLFPGGEYEGWVVVQSETGAQGLELVFESILDTTGESRRYISLEK
jgi:hypothetical protein